jgi:hypothetical protein
VETKKEDHSEDESGKKSGSGKKGLYNSSFYNIIILYL